MSAWAHRGEGQRIIHSKTDGDQKTGCLGRICSRRRKSRIPQANNKESESTRAVMSVPDGQQNGGFKPENIYRNGMDNSNLKGMNNSDGETSEIKQGKRYGEFERETVSRVEPWKEQQRTQLKQENFDESLGDKRSESSTETIRSAKQASASQSYLPKEQQKDFKPEYFKKDGNYMDINSAKINNRSSGYLEGQEEGGESQTKKTITSAEPAGFSVWEEKQRDFFGRVGFNKDNNHTESSSPKIYKRSMSSSEQASLSKEKQKDFVRAASFIKDDNKFTENSPTRINNSGIVHKVEQQQKVVPKQERNAERQIKKTMSNSTEKAGLSFREEKQKDFVRQTSFNKDENYAAHASEPKITRASLSLH